MREQVLSSKNSSNYGKSVQNSILRRTAITQLEQDSNAVPTQEEIENQQYQQDQFEATSLEIQAKHGTITPEGQERLNLLQAKKAEFWQRYLAPVRHSKDFADIPITCEQAEAKSKKAIQTKLTIGTPGDKYEQEADRVAAQVVNQINSPTTQQSNQNLQREELPVIQTRPWLRLQAKNEGMAASAELESSIQQARGGGQPLADNVRKPMERAFGADFSRVKVHADTQADKLNQSIQARAFTTGQDVFFRQGEYQPGNRGGQELIAHELTHVVQQTDYQQRRLRMTPNMLEGACVQRSQSRPSAGYTRLNAVSNRNTVHNYGGAVGTGVGNEHRGISVDVTVYPGQCSHRSPADQNIMQLTIQQLNNQLPTNNNWIRGHLFNDQLGGSGADNRNLVPMSHTTNVNWEQQFESRMKAITVALDSLYSNMTGNRYFMLLGYIAQTNGQYPPANPIGINVPNMIIGTWYDGAYDRQTNQELYDQTSINLAEQEIQGQPQWNTIRQLKGLLGQQIQVQQVH